METKRKPPKMNVGSASLVVIFSVLCLTVFAVLSLSSAMVEKKLAETSAKAIKDFYAADLYASEMADELGETYTSGGSLDEWAERNNAELENAQGAEYISYKVPIDDTQALFVRLELTENINILNWQVIQTADWTPDTSVDVWDGSFE